ncbi:hypothetical protein DEJ30_13950 [Curtobacterium sp. MCPF17_003]|uniref:DNA primase family protein n=1 Tax=Curtobacterium sp. MCPF17_003 TaxID=2175637 RepID=UPI000D978E3D|nr:phage/plasmid primase, P4 family [Curtobacterium sp. MCPF17_003]PYY63346.1 hypothetical protein DEJ30_13950 [Curtobacterium sp. MCPF17_003]
MTELPKPSEAPGAAMIDENLIQDSLLAEYIATGKVTYSTGRINPIAPLRHSLRWVKDWGWMQWDGQVWSAVPEPVAIDVVRAILKEMFVKVISAHPDPHTNTQYKILLAKNKAVNVSYFLKGLLTTDAAEFDRYPDYLNAQNGIIDLTSGTIFDHHPKWMLTKITAVDYYPGAEHKDWHTALQALPDDVREYMQVRYGQAITGHPVDDDVLIIQKGGGQNGKSTITQGIHRAVGGYGVVVPDKVLLANPGEHPTEMMTLRGARYALIEETPDGHRLPTKRLKDLIGTPVMTARAMRQDFVSWNTTHTLFVDTNYDLQVAETDHGTWRRLQLVLFPYKYVHPSEPLMAPNERHGVPGLRERIRDNTDAQLEAVLAWVVEGARLWYGNDRAQLPTPLTIQSDTQAWRAEADLILAYAQDRLSFDPTAMMPTTDLFEDFTDWLRESGRSVWNDQTFTSRFSTHDLCSRNNVTKDRINVNASTIFSRRYAFGASTLTGKVRVWKGVRFNS